MEGQPDPLFVGVFVAILLLSTWALKSLFKKKPKPTTHIEVSSYPEEEETDMPATTAIYDNADANELLRYKINVLELAVTFHDGQASADAVAKTARIWWDFIALKPDDDSDE